MGVSYTETGGTETYRGYSSGIAAATMTWNGSAFGNVTFSSGSAGGPSPAGGDRVAVRTAGARLPTAPCLAVVQAGLSLPADATSGATDRRPDAGRGRDVRRPPGPYTVTGTYTVSATDGTATSAPYTATLYFDGQNFQIVSIAGS